MSWKKHFTTVAPVAGAHPVTMSTSIGGGTGMSSKYSSYLPEVYSGHPNRVQRYYQYDDMDKDSDIRASLDVIADFCTQSEEQSDLPFEVVYDDYEGSEVEVKMIQTALNKWVKLNNFRSILWDIFRGAIKNGDQFFLRDPETGEWEWMDHFMVEMVKVDEKSGKTPEEYIVRGLDFNKQARYATVAADPSNYRNPFGTSGSGSSRGGAATVSGPQVFSLAGSGSDPRTRSMTNGSDQMHVIDADNIVHLSLSAAVDINWPFGQSVLEAVFKTYKQKELLEDAVIIYRVQRAPERRIFYIDTGSMPPVRAKAHIEQIKNEIHQRRIPNRSGGGSSILDAAYNPLAVMDDYFFAQGTDGRGSKVETLSGGDQLGEITDLTFFSKKLARGLQIPPSYLSIGDDQQPMTFNDGKMGSALVQEFRFNKYCMRIQSRLAPVFDRDFKRFMTADGIAPELAEIFTLRFREPQSFTRYRQIELDSQQVGVYQQVADNKRLSERFKLKRFLGLSEAEILENERLYMEENPNKTKKGTGATSASGASNADLGSVGLRAGGGDDMGDFGAPPPDDGSMPPDGGDAGGMDGGGSPPVAGPAPAPAGGDGAPPA